MTLLREMNGVPFLQPVKLLLELGRGAMAQTIGRLNPMVKLQLCRLLLGMVTTVLALQLTSMQLVANSGSPVLATGPAVHRLANRLAPLLVLPMWLPEAPVLVVRWQVPIVLIGPVQLFP